MTRWRSLPVWVFIFVAAAAPVLAEPRRSITITIDDLPWVEFARSTPAEVAERHARLVEALAREKTRAIGFVNEDKLERDGAVDPARVAMLADWLRAGLTLGNHTYGHPSLHRVSIQDYEKAIVRGEAVTRPLLASNGGKLEWFRHPFLQAGRDDETRNRLARFLAERGYRIAPVTVDNGDWIYARAYVDALNAGNGKLARRIRSDFLDYMERKLAFYEKASRDLFAREIPQILLLHANALNADTFADLSARMKRRGYRYIALAEAVADPAYGHADAYRGGAGISWIHRWAMAEGKPKDFYAGEPEVPRWILDLAGVDGE
jgi:peptidoglycan/xylan/chitin deacetylase (PgdA/CDA1 family)